MKQFFKSIGTVAVILLVYVVLQLLVPLVAGGIYVLVSAAAEGTAGSGLESVLLMVEEGMTFIVNTYTSELVGLSNLVTMAAFVLYYHKRNTSLCREVGCNPLPGPRSYLPIILMAMAMAFVLSFGLPLLPLPETITESYIESSSTVIGRSVLAFLCNVIIAPITEEVVFRGLVYRQFKKAMPTLAAGILSCAIFGALHEGALWITYTVCVGAIMTIVYEKYGSILANIIFHMVFNLIGGYVTVSLTIPEWAYYAILMLSLGGFLYLLMRLIRRPMPASGGEEP